MGSCISSAGGVEVSEQEKQRHRAVEKELKEVRILFNALLGNLCSTLLVA
jgi:hypothetical protein